MQQGDLAKAVAVTSAVFVLPTAIGSLGWFHSFIPLPIIFYLVYFGPKQGATVVAASVALSVIIAAILGVLPSLLFSLTLLPLGYIIAKGIRQHEAAIVVGIKGIVYLTIVWLMFGVLHGTMNQVNPYLDIQKSMQDGFEATYKLYENSGQFSAEALKDISAFFKQMQALVARILPALLFGTIIGTVWLNVVCGHWLLKRKSQDLTCWDNFKGWRLPEYFVWPVIVAGIAYAVPAEGLNTFGLNLGIILAVLFFSQGLAILAFALEKWAIPPLFRFFIYSILLIQIYGFGMLAAIGLADVWLNFRKRAEANDREETER